MCYLQIWQMTLQNNRAPLLCCFKLCALCHSHQSIQIGVTVWITQFGSKSAIFVRCDLEVWQMNLKNNRTYRLCCFKLCASFHSHQSIKTGVTVRRRVRFDKHRHKMSKWITSGILKSIHFRDKLYRKCKSLNPEVTEYANAKINLKVYNGILSRNIRLTKQMHYAQ